MGIKDYFELLRKELNKTDKFLVGSGEEKSCGCALNHGVDVEVFHLFGPIWDILGQKIQKSTEILLKNGFNLFGSLWGAWSEH